ncbi:SDR family oxidoreductase, partial [Rhodoferax sp. TS-BS-61-7]|uniref:SDR family oxidoreductase n=1 Tax=Rhodoferax sp. TS-BS-61-7 TaxID=2094194 RepID=UPI000CF69ECF
TGASGHLGQRVLCHLIDTLKVSPQQVIATTRKPDSLAAWAARGVDVRAADFDNEASLVRAFQGAGRVLLISTDADASGQRVQQHQRAIAAAENSGVEHLIYTSMPDPQRSLVLFAPDHAETEAALSASQLSSWTVLRNHWYFENLQMLLPSVMERGGKWFSAAGDGKVADIARDDLALAAAHELANPSPGKTTYTISGAQAFTAAEQAQQLSSAIGKPIQFIPVSPEDLLRGMIRGGVPEHFAQLLASFDANVAAGQMGHVSADFEKITGRKPQPFADWLAANRAALSGS